MSPSHLFFEGTGHDVGVLPTEGTMRIVRSMFFLFSGGGGGKRGVPANTAAKLKSGGTEPEKESYCNEVHGRSGYWRYYELFLKIRSNT